MFSRVVICLATLALCITVGCAKKKKNMDTSALLSQMPKTEEPVKKDSADIFDEFYEGTAGKTGTAAKKEPTFSTSPAAVAADFVSGGPFVVQVSCVRVRSLADKVAGDLEGKGFPSYVAEVSNPTADLMGTYYRVRIGGFSSIPAARSFGDNTLTQSGYEYWVDNRSNDNVGLSDGLGSSSTESMYTSQPAAATPSTSSSSTDWGSSSTPVPETSTYEQSSSTPASSDAGSGYGSSTTTTTTTPATESTDYGSGSSSTTATESSPPPSSGSGSATKDEWGTDGGW